MEEEYFCGARYARVISRSERKSCGAPCRAEPRIKSRRRVESRELKVEKFHDRTAIELTHRIIYRSVSSSFRDEAAGASDIILATLQQVTGPAFQKRGKKDGRRFGFAFACREDDRLPIAVYCALTLTDFERRSASSQLR